MTRYVITSDVALRLAEEGTAVPAEHQLLAPTLLRSQLLSRLYRAVGRGELTKAEAGRRLDHVRGLRIRLLATASCRTPPGRSPTSWAGPTRTTPSTWP